MRVSNSSSTLNLRLVISRNFLITKPNINLFKNSLSYSCMLVWNSNPIHINNNMTLTPFVQDCQIITIWFKGKYVECASPYLQL